MPVCTIFIWTLEHLFVRLFEQFFYLQTCFIRMSSSQSWHHLLKAPLVKSASCPSLRQLWWKWHINLKWWHVACICVYLESNFGHVCTMYWNWHFKKEQVHLAGKPDQSKLSDRKLMSRHFCPNSKYFLAPDLQLCISFSSHSCISFSSHCCISLPLAFFVFLSHATLTFLF